MARGSEAKTYVTEQIFKTFENAFLASDGKTIRIPYTENGERIEIKVSLVAAKDCERTDDNMESSSDVNTSVNTAEPVIAEPTEEEKEKVKKLLSTLNF